MLHHIRERAKGWFAWLIVLFISIPFALWGINSYIQGDSDSSVASVNDRKISQYEFQNALQAENKRMQEMLGDNYRPELVDETILKQNVMQRLINNAALVERLNSDGAAIGEAQVDASIRSQQMFYDNGEFSFEKFQTILNQNFLTVPVYKQRVAQDMLVSQLVDGMSASQFVTEKQLAAFAKLINQKREVGYYTVSASAFMEDVSVADDEVNSFYDNNQFRFEQPAQIKVAYVELSSKQLAKDIPVSDEQVREYFETNIHSYKPAEKRRASHILVSLDQDASSDEEAEAKSLIEDIYQQLQDGADFAELAEEYSQDPGSAKAGGDLGFFNPGDMVPAFDEAVFSLDIGTVSEPVKTSFGYHLIKVTEVESAASPALAEVKDKVVADLQRELAQEQYFRELETLETIAYEQPDSLVGVKDALGLTVHETAFFAKGDEPDVLSNPKLLNAIFSDEVLEQGLNSLAIEVEPQHVVVARVVQRKSSYIQPLDEVKEEIVAQLKQEKALDLAADKAAAIKSQLSSTTDYSSLAQQDVITWHGMQEVTRMNRGDLPGAVIKKAFTLEKPAEQPSAAQTTVAGAAALVVVTNVTDGQLDEQTKPLFEQMLQRQYAEQALNMVVKQIRSEAEVNIKASALSEQ